MPKRSLILLIMFLMMSCTSLKFHPAKQKVADPRTKAEEDFNPLGFEEDKKIITKQEYHKKVKVEEKEEKSQIYTELDLLKKSVYEYKTVYRVQVYASKIPNQAEFFADSIGTILDSEKVYIEYQTPYYRVRIGDCSDFDEAEELLNRLRRIGFKQAWVVKTRIKIESGED